MSEWYIGKILSFDFVPIQFDLNKNIDVSVRAVQSVDAMDIP